jgi:thiol:disulfide interchange protein DsbC
MQLLKTALALAALTLTLSASAQEAAIRKNLAERFPQQLMQINEVTKSPIAGLYEVRYNDSEIVYTDADANYLVNGHIIDAKQRRDLTDERIEKLSAVDTKSLPYKDAFTIVRGDGSRKLVVFEDPNCGYCKRFEADLQKVNNVTIHMFLYPILGKDSVDKSKNIWCAKDKGKAWQDWMLRETPVTAAAAGCDTGALTRNVELGRKSKITGTPTLFFENGSRVPGAINTAQIEKLLTEAKQ